MLFFEVLLHEKILGTFVVDFVFFGAGTAYGITFGSRPMDQAAKQDLWQQQIDHPSYAWDKPFCLRYRVAHPNLLILGDSIFDGWSGYLLHVFPGALIDARVGRQFSAGVRDYAELLRYPGVQAIQTIILELGTNGPVTPQQVEQFMQLAGPNRQVYWVTPSVPRPWQQEVLEVAHWAAHTYPNVHLIHWHQAAKGHTDWFWRDGVHPNWSGIQRLVALLSG